MQQNRYLYSNKNRSTMNLQATKMELIEMLISTRKAKVLKKIRTILEEEQDRLTEEDYKIIDVRRERHLKGESQSFSWEEAKQKIQKSIV
jgi:oligoendopeptidase F